MLNKVQSSDEEKLQWSNDSIMFHAVIYSTNSAGHLLYPRYSAMFVFKTKVTVRKKRSAMCKLIHVFEILFPLNLTWNPIYSEPKAQLHHPRSTPRLTSYRQPALTTSAHFLSNLVHNAYISWVPNSPILINNILLEHSHTICLCVIHGHFVYKFPQWFQSLLFQLIG